MSESKDNGGGHAFPVPKLFTGTGGFTKRQYAAILLKVPNSGLGWLDDMIKESQILNTDLLYED